MGFKSSLLQFYVHLSRQTLDADFDVMTLFRDPISKEMFTTVKSMLESSASADEAIEDREDFACFCKSLKEAIEVEPYAPGYLPLARVGLAYLLSLPELSQQSTPEVLSEKLNILFSSFVSTSSAYSDDVSEYERLVIELICSVDNQPIYQMLCELMERAPINLPAAVWRNKLYDCQSLFILAAQRGGVAFISEVLAADNQPRQEEVAAALTAAAAYEQLGVVEKLLDMKWDIVLVYKTFVYAVNRGLRTVVEMLVNSIPDIKQRSVLLDQALEMAAKNGLAEIAETLLGLSEGNKPSLEVVAKALKAAADSGQLVIVEKLLGMTGDNRPSQSAVENALKAAVDSWQLVIVEKLLGMTGDNRPSQLAVESALNDASEWGIWTIVEKIIGMTGDNKPSSEAVEKVLERALLSLESLLRSPLQLKDTGEMGTVEKILNLVGDNAPNKKLIDAAVKVWEKYHPNLVLDKNLDKKGNYPLHDHAMVVKDDLNAFNDVLRDFLTITLHKYCTQENRAGLTPIHLLYQKLLQPVMQDNDLKKSNLSALLYELAVQSQENNSEIKRVLLSCAQEGKQLEAWMALAMLAFSEGQDNLQDQYISRLKQYSESIKGKGFPTFFGRIPSEKALCEALLTGDAHLIKSAYDPRHVAAFIQKNGNQMRSVCRLDQGGADNSPDLSIN